MKQLWTICIFLIIVGYQSYGQPTIDGPASVCEGESATYSVLESYQSYQWNTGATTQSITVSIQGVYSVTVTDQSNNMSTASRVLTVNPLPQVQIMGGSALCEGTNKLLTADAGFNTYLWNTDATTSSITISTPGIYSVTVTDNNNCTGEASIQVSQVSNPAPMILGPDFICPGSNETLDAGEWSTYEWNGGRNTRMLSITGAGAYSVTITDQNGCEGVSTKEVQEYSITPIAIEGVTEICEGEPTTLSINPVYGTILWNNGSTGPSITISSNGTYGVTVTDNNMCQVSESVEVTTPFPSISCPGDLFITVHEPTIDTMVQFNVIVLNDCGSAIPIIQTDTSGYSSGDTFPIGTTPQSFTIDVEGSPKGSCSFNVNVVQKSSKVIKMENGDLFIKGLYKGAIYQSPDGTCWKLVISNDGEIKAVKIDCPE